MGAGISRPWNVTSCGAFRRTNSDGQDPSNYKRIMVVDGNHDNASSDSRSPTQGQKNCSLLPKKDVVSSSLPKKDVVKGEKKTTSPIKININNNYQKEDEEIERISDYDGPMFMKSPSFSDFVRPIDLLDDGVKKGGKKGGEMRENKTEEAQGPDIVCTGEVCYKREVKKNEMPVENKGGSGKEKKIYKIFSQHHKPSTVSCGVKSLFYHQPKNTKQPN
ncbi:hypothetical protein POM88_043825 [Heracleum sosnowskyi]|uniref:Uncharacterized protein n=1 Tax=Heracleum sosnowskyi TaxID=360622 RepID=A0AAD8H4B5_9APIA|nr:hypothetical protein POM88_043825 [Heracleum sosnowskyi]